MSWITHTNYLLRCLHLLEADINDQVGPDINAVFNNLRDKTNRVKESGGTIYFIGNGASASMASHFSADIAKNARVKTHVFTDLSLMTAFANDLSYEDVFSEPLKQYMSSNDMLVAISSSGESPNILKAAGVVKEKGADIMTLSAMSPNNSLRKMGFLNFYLPAETYGMAETGHSAILHYWVDLLTGDER